MDLALNLGIPLQDVKKLSEKELVKWSKYAEKYAMPQRRLEMYLAQIAMWAARGAGLSAEDTSLEMFMFDPEEVVQLEDALANDKEALGFNPQ